MGKMRILEWVVISFSKDKKVRDTKGTFHAKIGTIKDRNGRDLEAEDIKKRWQEYQNCTKKIFMTQIITMV